MEYLDFIKDSFVRHFDDSTEMVRSEGLPYCLDLWVEYGDAVEVTGGDFGLYMRFVIHLLSEFTNPESSDHVTQPLPRSASEHDCFSPEWWNAMVFRWKYTRSGERRQDRAESSQAEK